MATPADLPQSKGMRDHSTTASIILCNNIMFAFEHSEMHRARDSTL